ncbi:MAG: hypothetical protein AAF196_19960 [Planctomycetota bacterium]
MSKSLLAITVLSSALALGSPRDANAQEPIPGLPVLIEGFRQAGDTLRDVLNPEVVASGIPAVENVPAYGFALADASARLDSFVVRARQSADDQSLSDLCDHLERTSAFLMEAGLQMTEADWVEAEEALRHASETLKASDLYPIDAPCPHPAETLDQIAELTRILGRDFNPIVQELQTYITSSLARPQDSGFGASEMLRLADPMLMDAFYVTGQEDLSGLRTIAADPTEATFLATLATANTHLSSVLTETGVRAIAANLFVLGDGFSLVAGDLETRTTESTCRSECNYIRGTGCAAPDTEAKFGSSVLDPKDLDAISNALVLGAVADGLSGLSAGGAESAAGAIADAGFNFGWNLSTPGVGDLAVGIMRTIQADARNNPQLWVRVVYECCELVRWTNWFPGGWRLVDNELVRECVQKKTPWKKSGNPTRWRLIMNSPWESLGDAIIDHTNLALRRFDEDEACGGF